MRVSPRLVVVGYAIATLAQVARAQCETQWSPDFGSTALAPTHIPGYPTVLATLVVDDPDGVDDLYIGGNFVHGSSRFIVRYDGQELQPLGVGFTHPVEPSGAQPGVFSIVRFNSVAGPQLIVGGMFSQSGAVAVANVARWTGTQWAPLGLGLTEGAGFPVHVRSMIGFDDGLGGGERLYVTGFFMQAGGSSANAIARWTGLNWSAVGTGFDGEGHALAVFDDGNGPALYAGGVFEHAGGVTVNKLARWNGVQWSALGSGVSGDTVEALVVHDGALYVAGRFTAIDGVPAAGIARFDGTSWTALGSGTTQTVNSIGFFDSGSGSQLHIAGSFDMAGGVSLPGIARWNGTTFEPLGASSTHTIVTMSAYDDGSGAGAELVIGGSFISAGGAPIQAIAKWNESSWGPLHPDQGMNAPVRSFATYDDGNGPALYAGGDFTRVSEVDANCIAKFDGLLWTPLGNGISGTPGTDIPTVSDLVVFDAGLGAGPELFAVGYFSQAGGVTSKCIARWSGGAWSGVGGGVNGTNGVASLESGAAFDSGTGAALYVSGVFTSAGGIAANGFAKWDGTSWSAPSGYPRPSRAHDMLAFDDGTGPALYAVGDFATSISGTTTNRIGRFDGTTWTLIGSFNARVITAYDDGLGGGLDLYVGGPFSTAAGVLCNGIARWNGSVWSALAGGVTLNDVRALGTFDDGSGTQLYASGYFTSAGGVPAQGIARWNGQAWSAVDGGLVGSALAIHPIDLGPLYGNALFVGGSIGAAGGHDSLFIARWAPECPGDTFCSADGIDPAVTTACPCGNVGSAGHGCANSFEAGASLSTSGSTAADEFTGTDTIILHGALMPPTAGCTYLKGNASIAAGVVFGDGVRCAGGSLIRLGSKPNVGGASQYPETGDLSLSERGQTPIGSGVTAYYQTSYRNADPSFCTSATFNITNGVKIVW